MIRRCSPSGLSSCHLTHNLLLVMPGVFVDTVAWLLAQFLASTLQTATSFRLHDILFEKKKKKICCSPEKTHHLAESLYTGGKHAQDDCCTDDAD